MNSHTEIHRARPRRVPRAGASVSVESGCTTFYVAVFTNAQVPGTPHFCCFMEALANWRDYSLTQSLVRLPFLKDEWQGWKFQASHHGLILLMMTPHPGTHHLPHQNKRLSCHPDYPKKFKRSVPETRGRDQYMCFPLFHGRWVRKCSIQRQSKTKKNDQLELGQYQKAVGCVEENEEGKIGTTIIE